MSSQRSSRSEVKTVRFPNDVIAEIRATAAKRGVGFNDEVIRRVTQLADPDWTPEPDEGQMSFGEVDANAWPTVEVEVELYRKRV